WQEEFPNLRKRYWGQHLWARRYCCARVGGWMRKPAKPPSRTRNGRRTSKVSKSPRPPSLEALGFGKSRL
ncbi:MAG: transposase, partial [Acidobacteriaceae bacterium]|nr:transposase [Acidobacteriaceae bacterium]